jgi:hypothetical protein
MLELTEDTIANAARRARDMHQRVSRLSDTEIAVTCANDGHPRGHVCRYERRADGSLWADCLLRDTGELCPAHLGRHVCFHLASGVVLFLALEERNVAADPDAATEHAVRFGGAMPRLARERWDGRFVCKRTHKGPAPEGDPDAVLVPARFARTVVREGGRTRTVERCGPFQI